MVELEAKVSVEGVGSSKDALETLNQLIKKRSEQLHQTTFQATAATMVNALKSIRQTTMDAKKKKRFNIVIEQTPYYVGFSNSEQKPCLRSAPSPKAPKVTVQGRVVYLTRGIINPLVNAHVYKVTQEKPAKTQLYIACMNEKIAEEYALKATRHRIDTSGTLAKDAIGVAIGRVAEKSFKLEGKSKSSTRVATVSEHRSGGQYTLRVDDNLDYSTEALKGGEAAVEVALQKAANKCYGILAHLAGIDFTAKFPEKPFPEVGGRK